MNIRFYVTKKDAANTATAYLSDYRNSLLSYENGSWYFSSHYNGKSQISLTYSVLNFNQDLADLCSRLIQVGHQKAAMITKENVGQLISGKDINQITYSLVQKFGYIEDEKDIFDFASEFLVRVLNAHMFENGNKRTALIATRALLYEFGYYLKWSGGSTQAYLDLYAEKLALITDLAESKIKDGSEKAIALAKEWLCDNIVIGIINRER